jgi:hypothetical protein
MRATLLLRVIDRGVVRAHATESASGRPGWARRHDAGRPRTIPARLRTWFRMAVPAMAVPASMRAPSAQVPLPLEHAQHLVGDECGAREVHVDAIRLADQLGLPVLVNVVGIPAVVGNES